MVFHSVALGASSCPWSCAVPGRGGPQLCASLPGTGVAGSSVVQAPVPCEVSVVLVGDALERGAASLGELLGPPWGRAVLALA